MKNIATKAMWAAIVVLAVILFGCQDDNLPEIEVIVPTVQTVSVSNVSETTATVTGAVTSDGHGEITEAGVFFNGELIAGMISGTAISVTLPHLEPGAVYSVKAYARNEAGVGYGQNLDFFTSGSLSGVLTLEATEITTTSATLNAVIKGTVSTAVSFEYGLSTSYGSSVSAQAGEVITDGQKFSAKVSNLTPETKYYFRVKVEGKGYGNGCEFTAWPLFKIADAQILDVTTDNSGNIYAGGEIGNATHTFVARFNPDGTLVWKQDVVTSYSQVRTYRSTTVWNGTVYTQITHQNTESGEVFIYAYSAQTGELVWKKKITDGRAQDMRMDADGNIYSVCYSLIKLNSQGEELGRYRDPSGHSFYCVEVSDNSVYVGGARHNYDTQTAWVWRFDKDLNLIAEIEGSTARSSSTRNLLCLSGGGVISSEDLYENDGSGTKTTLRCYSSNNLLSWKKEIVSWGVFLEKNGENIFGFSLHSEIGPLKIDAANGGVIWTAPTKLSGDIAVTGDKIYVARSINGIAIINR